MGQTAKVAVLCEFSGIVRQALRDEGLDAWSFDLLPAEDGSPYHVQGDVLDHDFTGWAGAICHPPCTHLALSGAKLYAGKVEDGRIREGAMFALKLWSLPVPCLALENPIGLLSHWRKPAQIIQPFQFGHGERKAICLWLRGLPKLEPTWPREEREPLVHWAAPGPNRWKERSRFYPGVAIAMARQWKPFFMEHV